MVTTSVPARNLDPLETPHNLLPAAEWHLAISDPAATKDLLWFEFWAAMSSLAIAAHKLLTPLSKPTSAGAAQHRFFRYVRGRVAANLSCPPHHL